MTLKRLLSFTRIASMIALVFIATCCASLAQAAEPSAWVFQQTHFDNGRNRIFVSENAVKIVSLSSGFEIVAKAPTWRIVLSRPDDKIQYETDLSGFRQFSVFGPMPPAKPTQQQLIRLDTQKQKNMDVVSYKTVTPFRQYWLVNATVNRRVIEIIRIYYRLLDGSKEPGIPLKYVISRTPSGATPRKHSWMNESPKLELGAKTWLSTEEWGATAYNASEFEYPSGFKPVRTASEILVSTAKKKDLDLLIDGLGIGERQGGKSPF